MASTSCAGCAHAKTPPSREPCNSCWESAQLGVHKNWEKAVTKEALYIDPPITRLVHGDAGKGAVVGRKDDSGKLDVTLFFNDLPHAIEGVTEVLQWAITKKQPVPYERGSWQQVPDFQRRYQGAQLRHELNRAKRALAGAPETDAETELLELQHIAAAAMFRLEMAIRKRKGLPVPEGA